MTNESNFPAVFFEDFLAALRKVQDENRIHGNVEVFELRPSPDGAVHLGVSWPSIGTVPPEEAKKFRGGRPGGRRCRCLSVQRLCVYV